MGGADDVIALRNVSKEFQQGPHRLRALDGIDLAVPRGQFLSIVGPSGSGKSTLLHVIGGLDRPTGGEVEVQGRRLSTMSDHEITLFRRRSVGFVYQFFNLLPALDATENVALPLLLDGKPMREVRARVEALLDLVGLRDRRGHRPDELSGGEMQRVAVARALVVEPTVLLADEPTGNLDRRSGLDVLDLIKRANVERGQTVLLVTHDDRAAAYGERIVTLTDGRIVHERHEGGRCERSRQ